MGEGFSPVLHNVILLGFVFQNLVPGPPFAFGAVLVILALIVAAFIPEHPSASFRKLNSASSLELKKDAGKTGSSPQPSFTYSVSVRCVWLMLFDKMIVSFSAWSAFLSFGLSFFFSVFCLFVVVVVVTGKGGWLEGGFQILPTQDLD